MPFISENVISWTFPCQCETLGVESEN